MVSNGTEHKARQEELAKRIEALEQQVAELGDSEMTGAGLDDPELVHKIVHACMESETITDEEELQILEALLDRR